MDATKRLSTLIFRSLTGELTPAEQQELDAWLAESPANRSLYEELGRPEVLKQGLARMYEAVDSRERVLDKVRLAMAEPPGKKEAARVMPLRRWLPYAAAAILAATATLLWWQKPQQPATPVQTAQTAAGAIPPGATGAVLTLADGSVIELDSLHNGTIAAQGATRVILQNGQLSYKKDKHTGAGEPVAYNTITTPRGRQFQLLLPDGTRVWLNAASSLTYPTAFSDTARNVTITGEAYFEVTHLPAAPFRVKIGPQREVTVLGTRFNVNAYVDEPEVTTTLLEGSVMISAAGTQKMLKPGYQAGMREQEILLRPADLEGTMAWKNGLFIFNKTDIHAVMRQLSRWYDVEVVFEGQPAARQLTGEVYRSYTLQQALAVLQAADLHFRISGRQLTVLP
ncbi:FecR domain-containing protein [Chitinophaga sp.]|uniref:FecR domain-containing protein n=1 Tax=Chitinophaga sp. TaxID=1869181 RepID=UPI0031E3A066